MNLSALTTGEPTYWSTDPNTQPDLLDLCFIKRINLTLFSAHSCLDLSTDHSLILVTLGKHIIIKEKLQTLTNQYTNWTIQIQPNTSIQFNAQSLSNGKLLRNVV